MAISLLPQPVAYDLDLERADACQESPPVMHHDLIHPGDAQFAGEMEIAGPRSWDGKRVRVRDSLRDGYWFLSTVEIPGRGCNIGELEIGQQLRTGKR